MMTLANNLALVNWELGTYIIGFFVVVCAALIFIVIKMIYGDKKE
ncbi:MAG: hypothetical protein RI572_07125 [Salegentibacter sp.]|nr:MULTISPECIES: hypothetical protein [Salegentibacter]MDR9457166.1 hypothetical protein [Salegentibacter sp.]